MSQVSLAPTRPSPQLQGSKKRSGMPRGKGYGRTYNEQATGRVPVAILTQSARGIVCRVAGGECLMCCAVCSGECRAGAAGPGSQVKVVRRGASHTEFCSGLCKSEQHGFGRAWECRDLRQRGVLRAKVLDQRDNVKEAARRLELGEHKLRVVTHDGRQRIGILVVRSVPREQHRCIE